MEQQKLPDIVLSTQDSESSSTSAAETITAHEAHIDIPHTRIAELLRTNEPPLLHELKSALARVSAGRNSLEDLGTRVRELEGALAQARIEQHAIRRAISDYARISHPLRRFPDDILIEIFLLALGTLPMEDVTKQVATWPRSLNMLPLILSHVCAQWRAVAIGCSPLWSHFIIDFERHRVPSQKTLHRYGVWLQRSGGSPLHVWLDAFSGGDVDREQPQRRGFEPSSSRPPLFGAHIQSPITENHPLLTLITPSSPRWRTLTIRSHPAFIPCLRKLRGSFHSLDFLSVRYRGRVYHEAQNISNLLNPVPQLRNIQLYDVSERIQIPMHKLRALTAHASVSSLPYRCLPTPYHLLEGAENITSLSLAVRGYHEISQIKPLHLASLQILKLHLVEAWAIGDVLRPFTLPALQSLSVITDSSFDVQPIGALISRSQASVISVHVDGTLSGFSSDLGRLFTYLPNLQQLSIGPRVERLVNGLPSLASTPHLGRIEIAAKLLPTEWAYFVDWLESRVRQRGGGEHPLKLAMISNNIEDPELLRRLRECCDT